MRVAAVLFACVAVVHGFAGNLLNPRAAAGQRSSEEYAKPQTATQSTTDSEDYMEDKKSKHPGHHPTVGYFKRLCAGDKGVLDDQNRHIPPMREEEIDQWFKVHEVLWTHPPTIVYKGEATGVPVKHCFRMSSLDLAPVSILCLVLVCASGDQRIKKTSSSVVGDIDVNEHAEQLRIARQNVSMTTTVAPSSSSKPPDTKPMTNEVAKPIDNTTMHSTVTADGVNTTLHGSFENTTMSTTTMAPTMVVNTSASVTVNTSETPAGNITTSTTSSNAMDDAGKKINPDGLEHNGTSTAAAEKTKKSDKSNKEPTVDPGETTEPANTPRLVWVKPKPEAYIEQQRVKRDTHHKIFKKSRPKRAHNPSYFMSYPNRFYPSYLPQFVAHLPTGDGKRLEQAPLRQDIVWKNSDWYSSTAPPPWPQAPQKFCAQCFFNSPLLSTTTEAKKPVSVKKKKLEDRAEVSKNPKPRRMEYPRVTALSIEEVEGLPPAPANHHYLLIFEDPTTMQSSFSHHEGVLHVKTPTAKLAIIHDDSDPEFSSMKSKKKTEVNAVEQVAKTVMKAVARQQAMQKEIKREWKRELATWEKRFQAKLFSILLDSVPPNNSGQVTQTPAAHLEGWTNDSQTPIRPSTEKPMSPAPVTNGEATSALQVLMNHPSKSSSPKWTHTSVTKPIQQNNIYPDNGLQEQHLRSNTNRKECLNLCFRMPKKPITESPRPSGAALAALKKLQILEDKLNVILQHQKSTLAKMTVALEQVLHQQGHEMSQQCVVYCALLLWLPMVLQADFKQQYFKDDEESNENEILISSAGMRVRSLGKDSRKIKSGFKNFRKNPWDSGESQEGSKIYRSYRPASPKSSLQSKETYHQFGLNRKPTFAKTRIGSLAGTFKSALSVQEDFKNFRRMPTLLIRKNQDDEDSMIRKLSEAEVAVGPLGAVVVLEKEKLLKELQDEPKITNSMDHHGGRTVYIIKESKTKTSTTTSKGSHRVVRNKYTLLEPLEANLYPDVYEEQELPSGKLQTLLRNGMPILHSFKSALVRRKVPNVSLCKKEPFKLLMNPIPDGNICIIPEKMMDSSEEHKETPWFNETKVVLMASAVSSLDPAIAAARVNPILATMHLKRPKPGESKSSSSSSEEDTRSVWDKYNSYMIRSPPSTNHVSLAFLCRQQRIDSDVDECVTQQFNASKNS
ncbi:unnamed protein product [Notodromas monacha]|uniref:Uncharacterized protein n=1 Tax=Notodromas monacha TaxID=399045 RepID=A0A7R9BSZ9_9CRUS|nr:unnamed protein product [Notodromas monacha]CAG0921187.1 unnamed protein product [Notodromas monacha]